MAKSAGRLCVIKIATASVAGARVTGMTLSGTPIDVSDNGDAANIAYLADEMSEETMELTVSGVEDGQVLRDAAMSTDPANRHYSNLTFEFPNGDEISGSFIMTNYTETGDYREAQTFDATFVRNGQHTYTPAV
jgi:predicted secreted protein